MTWEHIDVSYRGPVAASNQATGLVEQGWLELAVIRTGKSRSLHGYVASVVVGEQEYNGASRYSELQALQACANAMREQQMELLCAGVGDQFRESGLSSGTGYGYVHGRHTVHVGSQGYARFLEPETLNAGAGSVDGMPPRAAAVHYFAYGSNMCFQQMAQRCPGAVCVGTAALLGFEYRINSYGVATLVPSPGKTVHGAVWLLTPQHENTLDVYEGVPAFYRRLYVALQAANQTLQALVYLANDTTPGVARPGYQENIVASAEQLGLPEIYVQELAGWLPAANEH